MSTAFGFMFITDVFRSRLFDTKLVLFNRRLVLGCLTQNCTQFCLIVVALVRRVETVRVPVPVCCKILVEIFKISTRILPTILFNNNTLLTLVSSFILVFKDLNVFPAFKFSIYFC